MKPRIFHIGLSATGLPRNGLQQAFINNSSQYEEINTGHPTLNMTMVDMAKTFQPDLIFIQVQTPNIIDPRAISVIKHYCPDAFIVNWTGDVRDPIEQWYYDLATQIHCTMFTNMNDVETFRKAGLNSEFLQIGINPDIYTPYGDTLANIPPIVFLANNYEEGRFPLSRFRVELSMAMKKEFGNQFGLYGNGWTFADGSYNHSQHEEAMVYRSAKIAINCSHFNYSRYSSDRLFRIMATGCACISHRYTDIEKDFRVFGEAGDMAELMVFDNIPELITLCKKLLNDEQARKTIARNGSEAVRYEYSFDNMIKNLIEIYRKQKNTSTNPPIYNKPSNSARR